MLVDDHTLFRKGLAELLDSAARSRSLPSPATATMRLRLLARRSPTSSSPTSTCRRTAAWPCCGNWGRRLARPVLVLTVSDAEDDLAAAMQAGAKGYLLKDMEPDDVVDAVQRAVRGETVVAPAMTLKLVNLLQGGSAAKPSADTCSSCSPRASAKSSTICRRACPTRPSPACSTSAMTPSSCT
jgi:two-component system nitrate/nitrite response regulator NarL